MLAACTAALPAAQAAPPQKLGVCVMCHGQQGVSQVPDAPNLAGQPETYLREQLRAFRSGKRPSETMNLIAKDLSDADIAELSGWFSSVEVTVKPRAQ